MAVEVVVCAVSVGMALGRAQVACSKVNQETFRPLVPMFLHREKATFQFHKKNFKKKFPPPHVTQSLNR